MYVMFFKIKILRDYRCILIGFLLFKIFGNFFFGIVVRMILGIICYFVVIINFIIKNYIV